MAHHNGGATIDTRRTRTAGLILPIEAQPHLQARQAERLQDAAAIERHRECLEQQQGDVRLDAGFVISMLAAVCVLVYFGMTSTGNLSPANVTLMVLATFAVAGGVICILFALTLGHITKPVAEDEAWAQRDSDREA